MDLKAKSHLLSRQCISKIALNLPRNILAVAVEAQDTTSFYQLKAEEDPAPLFQGTSKPAGNKSVLAWSKDGTLLALGSNTLELWRLDAHKLSPLKTFSQGFVQVKVLSWSPDSQLIAYGGLSRKNTVKVRNVASGQTRQIALPLAVCAISFDPFGKYLLLLLRSNVLIVYHASSLTKIREVALSPNAEASRNVSTVREVRGMDWSPDFGLLAVPSLDDSKVALALALSRTHNFQPRQAFLGHVSSISCARFNPVLFEWQGEATSILALGDSHGVVSIWRLGKSVSAAPLLLSNSVSDYCQVVQELEWDEEGSALIVNILKRYVTVLNFDRAKFGKPLSGAQKAALIQEAYGIKSASEIQQRKLQVFSLSSLPSQRQKHTPPPESKQEPPEPKQSHPSKNNTETPNIPQQPSPIIKETTPIREEKPASNQEKTSLGQERPALSEQQPVSHPSVSQQPVGTATMAPTGPVQYVKLADQVTSKGKDNRKRIQPAVLVRRDELPSLSARQAVQFSRQSVEAPSSWPPLNLKPLSSQISLLRMGKRRYLQIRRMLGMAVLRSFEQGDAQRALLGERVFNKTIDWVKLVGNKLYILNAGSLFTLNSQLQLLDLPYCIGEIHALAINLQGDIYFLTTKGLLKGFNPLTKQCYTPSPVALQQLLQGSKWKANEEAEGQEQWPSVVQDCWVEDNHNFYLSLAHSRDKYFYCKDTRNWISLVLNAGLIQSGHSLRVAPQEEALSSSFFRSLTAQFLPDSRAAMSAPASLQQLESNMVYYRVHKPNRELYLQSLLRWLQELSIRGQSEKLRSEIVKYLVDQGSQWFEKDSNLRNKVKEIGGNVIQEFILFGKL